MMMYQKGPIPNMESDLSKIMIQARLYKPALKKNKLQVKGKLKIMQIFGVGDKEMEMARLLWARERIGSGEVVRLCREEFNWTKSTTYTMLRRLCEHGLFQNINSIVTPVMSEEEYLGKIAKQMVDDKFDGSLPGFLRCVLREMKLTNSEIEKFEEILK